MKILFLHQNFPGQFIHLSKALADRGHDCLALGEFGNNAPSPIRRLQYKLEPGKVDRDINRLGLLYTRVTDRGLQVARVCRRLRDQHGFSPDVIVAHSGWGETLFLKHVFPRAKVIAYAEFHYGPGLDADFDPEFAAPALTAGIEGQARAAHLGQALLHADAAIAPTRWQASTHPAILQPMIEVIHDGIDTARVRPDPEARFELPSGRILRPGDEVLSFVNRNLEPYRGYHIFMRALPDMLAARPDAQVVIVGADGVSYGRSPPEGKTWRQVFHEEVADRLDPARVHFTGHLPYARYLSLLQVARVHAYLTYPFVLSWSLTEAMAAGVHVVASRTPPVEEVIRDGENGTLVDFFDVPGWSAALTAALADPARHDPLRRAARDTILRNYALPDCLARQIALVERVAAG